VGGGGAFGSLNYGIVVCLLVVVACRCSGYSGDGFLWASTRSCWVVLGVVGG